MVCTMKMMQGDAHHGAHFGGVGLAGQQLQDAALELAGPLCTQLALVVQRADIGQRRRAAAPRAVVLCLHSHATAGCCMANLSSIRRKFWRSLYEKTIVFYW
jgi:hypothetical protein